MWISLLLLKKSVMENFLSCASFSIIITIASTGIAKKYYDVSNMRCSDENAT